MTAITFKEGRGHNLEPIRDLRNSQETGQSWFGILEWALELL